MELSNRMYSKTELGLLYFPEATSKATARRHLMDWVKRCIPLWDELKKLGLCQFSLYCVLKSQKSFALSRNWCIFARKKEDYGNNCI